MYIYSVIYNLTDNALISTYFLIAVWFDIILMFYKKSLNVLDVRKQI